MALAHAAEDMGLHGRLSLVLLDSDNREVDRRDGDNVVCTNGFTVIASALVWSGVQDQAATIGVTSPTYLTPLFGAVGSGAGTPASSDTQLYSELSRQTVNAGAYSPASISIAAQAAWVFYFPSPAVTWTVTEAGVFANGTPTANTGTMLDHQVFSPSLTVTTTNSLILQVSFGLGP